ncbi:MAG: immunoglobulin-like domain-containing protein [Enterococcus sp.]
MKKEQLFRKVASPLVCGLMLGGLAITTVQPLVRVHAEEQTAIQSDAELTEDMWMDWSDVTKSSEFGNSDTTGKQVKYNEKIYAATWWKNGATDTAPGSGEETSTGWAEVGSIASNGTVTLDAGVTANPFETTVDPDVDPNTPYASIDAGQGVKWADQVFAPYIDGGLWYNGENGYQGLYPLGQEVKKSNISYANIGFIVSDPSNPKTASFGGYYNVDGTGTNGSIVTSFANQIKEFREQGGDVLVSFGGENGTPLQDTYDDAEELADKYIEIVEHYGLTTIDFDIEGAHVRDKEAWQRNNDAIKIMQEKMGDEAPAVWYTFPVLPTGLVGEGTDNDAYNVLQDAVTKGVEVHGVNIMTMCFGPAFVTGPTDTYYTYIEQASESLAGQIKKIYTDADQELTDEQVYGKIGLTPWAGKSSQANETFTLSDAKALLAYANEKQIGMLSFWSLNRDNDLNEDLKNTGLEQDTYEFSSILDEFDGELGVRDQAPTIKGATNKTINLNDTFDRLDGITAMDNEDGDLTAALKVTGDVDTSKAGKYKVTYTVVDSKQNKTEKIRTITVVDPDANTKPIINGAKDQTIEVGTTFDATKDITVTDNEDGDLTDQLKVVSNVDTTKVGTYTVTYSVIDSRGEETKQTITVTVTEKEEIPAYSSSATYVKGDKVTYDGATYTAQWWTKGEKPGTAQVWSKEVIKGEDGSVDYYKGGTYVAGDLVNYNGKQYLAKWWTQTTPGSDSSWELQD